MLLQREVSDIFCLTNLNYPNALGASAVPMVIGQEARNWSVAAVTRVSVLCEKENLIRGDKCRLS